MTKILIVGGVAGGASAAARARRLDENAQIIMFERGEYISFANCGLPYHISGDIEDRSALLLQTPESFKARFNVDVRIHNEVVDIDKTKQIITVKNLNDGTCYTESYDFLILSPGASPVVPNIDGIQNPLTHTLRNIPDMDKIKQLVDCEKVKHATVLGGGFIGLEMVEALRAQGVETSLITSGNQVLSPFDKEMASIIHVKLLEHENKVSLHLNQTVSSIEYLEENNHKFLNLKLKTGSPLKTDLLILAIGVKPELTLAKKAGLKIGELGGIWTNSQMQTSEANIYAAGDAIEDFDFITKKAALIPLAGPANRQGRIIANNIFGKKENYRGTQGTSICKIFDLAAACTGKNEKQLKLEQIPYEKAYVHTACHASYYPSHSPVSLKLLFSSEDGKILGAQACGLKGVDKRIDVLAVAIRAGMNVEDLEHLELTYAPPYGSAKDVINQVGFVANNILNGDIQAIHYDEIDKLNDDQLLLDVRSAQEMKGGYIGQAINIPVDELRHRADELPKDKEIVVYCQVGLRGHVASRMLSNLGFKTRNLIGGYRTYHFSKNY